MPGMAAAKLDLESADLYANLGIPRGSSDAAIRKAYYQLALQYHPDRTPGHKAEFQRIGRAYEVLGDAAKRKLYDEAGVIDGEDLSSENVNFDAYFRELFQRVRLEDIEAFKATYVGSAEEYEDVLAAYRKRKGAVGDIVDDIFFGDDEDAIDRYVAIIKRAVSRGIIDENAEFHAIIGDDRAMAALKTKRRRRAAKEAKEAAQLAKDLGLDTAGGKASDNLHALIKNKKGRFDSMIAGLEAKYGGGAEKSSKKAKK